MNYTKPEIAVLGVAVAVIEQVGKVGGNTDLPGQERITPAYDLDE